MTRPRMHETGRQVDALQRLDPVSLAAALSLLPPDHPLVTAARTGLEVGELRDERREAMRQASKDIAEGWRHSAMDAVKHDELERRRDWNARAAELPRQRADDTDPELAAAFAVAEAACRAREGRDAERCPAADDAPEDDRHREDGLADVEEYAR